MAAPLCAQPGKDGDQLSSPHPNSYYSGPPRQALEPGTRQIPITLQRGAGQLKPGDLALLIQMQGATIAHDNRPDYGSLQSHWLHQEWLRIEQVHDDRVLISGGGNEQGLLHRYQNHPGNPQHGQFRWQLVRVPQLQQLTLSQPLQTLPWDGQTGGILALDVRRTLNLNGHHLDVAGKGFRGGQAINLSGALGRSSDFVYPAPSAEEIQAGYGHHASKGEGIAGTPRPLMTQPASGYPGGDMGRGAPANAGGGGNGLALDHQRVASGGGGGNGSAGQPGAPQPGGGLGGQSLDRLETLALGGGGGAGSQVDGPLAQGGNGGGLIVLRAARLQGPGSLDLRGNDGRRGSHSHGGGGAGGTLHLDLNQAEAPGTPVLLQGGKGGPDNSGQGGWGRRLYQTAHHPDQAALAIAGVAPGYQCQPPGHQLSGILFDDSSPTGALNSRQDDDEPGLAGWPIQIVDSQGSTIADTHTDTQGRFHLVLDEQAAQAKDLSLQIPVPPEWQPSQPPRLGQAPAQWHNDTLRWPFQATPDQQSPPLQLGLIKLPHWQGPAPASYPTGSTAMATFRYQASLAGAVRFVSRSHPEATLLIDHHCNDDSEQWQAQQQPWWPVASGDSLCVRLAIPVQAATTVILDVETRPTSNHTHLPLPVLSARAVFGLEKNR